MTNEISETPRPSNIECYLYCIIEYSSRLILNVTLHVHRTDEGYRAWGALKSVLSNGGLGIKTKKCLYEGVIVPTALYGSEAWGMRNDERRKVNVIEMKCLRSLVGVSRMNRVIGMKRCIGELE